MTNTLQRLLSIGAVLVLLAIAGAVLLLGDQNNEPIGCTMEAKICPDGTAVGRVDRIVNLPNARTLHEIRRDQKRIPCSM